MKIVHNSTQPPATNAELLEQAKAAEAADDLKKAEQLYQRLLRQDTHNETAYNRLMIIYRKQKEFKKELETVKDGIAAFEEKYASSIKTPSNKKVSHLSTAFLKATGLANKKGKPSYLPEPLPKWHRRKEILEKKLKKS